MHYLVEIHGDHDRARELLGKAGIQTALVNFGDRSSRDLVAARLRADSLEAAAHRARVVLQDESFTIGEAYPEYRPERGSPVVRKSHRR
jgi:hypothetical protein